MSIWKKLKNLWELSHFEITKFDNHLVITRRNEDLVIARPIEWEKQDMSHPHNLDKDFYFPKEKRPMATIIKLKPKDEVEQILKENADQS